MATPASASDPNQPIKYTSQVLTSACAAITATFGAASRNNVGTIGASRSFWVRAATGRLGELEIAGFIACCPIVGELLHTIVTIKIVVNTFYVKTCFLYFTYRSEYNTLRYRALRARYTEGFMPKHYDQNCPVAKALELVGDRWTLLMVRDLTDKGKDLGLVIGALATWGSRHVYPEAALVHVDCGHPVRVGYFCSHCNDRVRGTAVTLQRPASLHPLS